MFFDVIVFPLAAFVLFCDLSHKNAWINHKQLSVETTVEQMETQWQENWSMQPKVVTASVVDRCWLEFYNDLLEFAVNFKDKPINM